MKLKRPFSFFIRWSNGVVPYYFNASVTNDDRIMMRHMMKQMEKKSCVRFQEQTNPPSGKCNLKWNLNDNKNKTSISYFFYIFWSCSYISSCITYIWDENNKLFFFILGHHLEIQVHSSISCVQQGIYEWALNCISNLHYFCEYMHLHIWIQMINENWINLCLFIKHCTELQYSWIAFGLNS